MSPSPNQFSQPSGSDQAQTDEPTIRRPNPPPTAPSPAASISDTSSHEVNEVTSPSQEAVHRQQPIPPPSEPMQYRAIGLVRGKYIPSEEQFTRGQILVAEEQSIDAVLLGRVMSLVKNHLDLGAEHLWVVYPRTRQEDGGLHVQIVGVWEPEKLDKTPSTATEEETEPASVASQPDLESEQERVVDGYFSIRGEVIYQSQDQGKIIVKIRQAPRKDDDKPKFFKLTLDGVLERKAVGHFWDFQVQRQGASLLIQQGQDIGSVRPMKPRKPFKRRPGGKGPQQGPRRQDRPIRPGAKPTSDRPTSDRPMSDRPIPRPVKRQQSSGEG